MSEPAPSFSAEWWEVFLKESRQLSCPVVFKGALGQARAALFRQAVLDILATLARLRTARYGLRIYAAGRLLDSDEMNRIYDSPPQAGESLECWSGRVFPQTPFGIILNAGEKFHHGLSCEVAQMLAPLFERVGLPREGVQFSIFIGDYDKTPLGIHQDKRGENVIHLHVGPGAKTMYLWEPEQYRRLTDEQGIPERDFNALKPHARTFRFESGDLFFMPEGTFHIGAQSELSIGITVWQYTHTNQMLADNLHAFLLKQLQAASDGAIVHDPSPPQDTRALDAILAQRRLPDEYRGRDYDQLLRLAYLDWRHCLASNAGYRNPPFPRDDKASLEADDQVLMETPYRILTRDTMPGRMAVYVRGNKLEMNRHSGLIAMLDRLNQNQPCAVAELLELLDPAWPEKIGLHLLGELLRWRGIRRLEPPSD
ncbi:cupin domain-containing protein [Chromobacterium phragmitis]|uniref:cupin domain-containing protein n=1 Tax=Chromobacterium phragmitis TaxID=2202141 RepID=UPI00143D5B20|nr:cupin domain-containing protein [Chromobacterium phragmitis]